jgi:mttA/Hcf106 family protein
MAFRETRHRPRGEFAMVGSQDLRVVLAIGAFVFGATRRPELSRPLGQAVAGDQPTEPGAGPPAPPPRAASAERAEG